MLLDDVVIKEEEEVMGRVKPFLIQVGIIIFLLHELYSPYHFFAEISSFVLPLYLTIEC